MNAISTPSQSSIDLVGDALDVLRERLGIGATLVAPDTDSTEYQDDGEIDLFVDGQSRRYLVECKPLADRRAIAQQVKQRLSEKSQPGLLITSYVSREIANYCREIGLQFIDTHGNAYLNGPGLLVYVAGERHEGGRLPSRATGGVSGVAGLRIALALLSTPDMAASPYREIASRAGVSLGAVSNAIEDLEKRGYVIAGAAGRPRQLLEAKRLLDEWTLNYPVQLRPKLNSRRFSVPGSDWWKGEQLAGTGAVWSGDVAAKMLTNYLRPATQTIYVPPAVRSDWMKAFAKAHHARADPHGSLEVLDKFWDDGLERRPGVAPLAVVYADLLASLDPRAAEAASLIRKDWIDGTFNSA
jgi:hypothetical protein